MSKYEIAQLAFGYWLLGSTWITIITAMPNTRHNMPWPILLCFILIAGAVWPLIVFNMVRASFGKQDTFRLL